MRNSNKILILSLLFVAVTGRCQADSATVNGAVDGVVVNQAVQPPAVVQPKPPETVYKKSVKGEFSTIYKNIFTALENNSYFVIFEPNIGKNLSHFATRWGADYNKNQLDGIRSMVFCNGWYANQMSNLEPKMLALCPLHLTLYHKQGETTVVFVKPSVIAKGTAAESIAIELEQDVIKTIEAALLQ